MVVGCVDDFLFTGSDIELASPQRPGKELESGSLDKSDVIWCCKRSRRNPTNKDMEVSMQAYAENQELSEADLREHAAKDPGSWLIIPGCNDVSFSEQ